MTRKLTTIIITALALALPASAHAQTLTQTRTGTVAESLAGSPYSWTNPVRMFGTDNTQPAESHPANDEWTQWLYGSHLGFTVPSNATVTGVEVEHGVEVSGGQELMTAEIELVKGSTVLAGPTLEPQFASGAWPNDNIETEKYSPSVTPAEVDSTSFGVKIRDLLKQGGALIGVNRVKVTVTFTVPPLHLYSDNVALPEGPSTPGLGWGVLNVENPSGTWTCETIEGLRDAANGLTVASATSESRSFSSSVTRSSTSSSSSRRLRPSGLCSHIRRYVSFSLRISCSRAALFSASRSRSNASFPGIKSSSCGQSSLRRTEPFRTVTAPMPARVCTIKLPQAPSPW
jgi:hypothetical protein